MAEPKKEYPDFVTHIIPRIEVYQITDDELKRIEEGFNHTNQDFTFMLTSFSLAVALVIALLTGTFESTTELTFKAGIGVCIVTSMYTGWRWYSHRQTATTVISNIRSRRVDPEG